MAQDKEPTSIRFSAEARALIAALQDKLGLTRTAVLEMAVRRLAEAEGIRPKRSKSEVGKRSNA